jgi:hypothetical protein
VNSRSDFYFFLIFFLRIAKITSTKNHFLWQDQGGRSAAGLYVIGLQCVPQQTFFEAWDTGFNNINRGVDKKNIEKALPSRQEKYGKSLANMQGLQKKFWGHIIAGKFIFCGNLFHFAAIPGWSCRAS